MRLLSVLVELKSCALERRRLKMRPTLVLRAARARAVRRCRPTRVMSGRAAVAVRRAHQGSRQSHDGCVRARALVISGDAANVAASVSSRWRRLRRLTTTVDARPSRLCLLL